MTHHTAHPTPSRIHPHALLSILTTALQSKYDESKVITESIASDFAIHTPWRRLGDACICMSAPQPLFFFLDLRREYLDRDRGEDGDAGNNGNGDGSQAGSGCRSFQSSSSS